jgi:hypothetical protein
MSDVSSHRFFAGKAKRELKVDAAEDDFRNVPYDGPDDYDFM